MKQKRLLRLLLIDRSPEEAEVLVTGLRSAGQAIRPRFIGDAAALKSALHERRWDLALLAFDGPLKLEDGMAALLRAGVDLPVVVILDPGHGSECLDAALRAGARDAVSRDCAPHLQHVVARELRSLDSRRALRALTLSYRESERRCKALMASSQDAIAVLREGRHVYANGRYLQIFGAERADQLLGQALAERVAAEDRQELDTFLHRFDVDKAEPAVLEITGLMADGSPRPLTLELSAIQMDGNSCVQVVASGEEGGPVPAAGEAAEPADPLTGLATQTRMMSAVDQAIARALAENLDSAFIYLEMRDHGELEEGLGAAGYRRLLADVGAFLALAVSPEDLPARLDGARFAVLLRNGDGAYASEIANRLVAEMNRRLALHGTKPEAACCHSGVVPITGAQNSYAEVLASAYSACRASHQGGKPVQIYQPADDGPAGPLVDAAFLAELTEAVEAQRMWLVYQPIVRLSGEPIQLYEGFLRVENAKGFLIPPDKLFPAALASGLIKRIDAWVIESAIRTIAEQRGRSRDIHLFIKLSTEAIKDETLLLTLSRLLKSYGVPGRKLIIEISETSAAANSALARAFVQGLREFRCSAALEHFGAGINSLRLLERLPVDYLKVDSSLIVDLGKDLEALGTLRSIVETARQSNRLTIAECVEDAASLMILFDAGVDFAQGYYIQEPSTELAFDFASVME